MEKEQPRTGKPTRKLFDKKEKDKIKKQIKDGG